VRETLISLNNKQHWCH